MAEEILVFLVAGAENHKLYVMTAHDFVERHAHQVKSLMLHHARYHGDNRNIPALRKAQSLLKRTFAFRLAAHVVRRVVAV